MGKLENFIKTARGISLSSQEKAVIKRSLLHYIKEHPMADVRPTLSFWANPFSRLSYASAFVVVLIIGVLAGGGAGLAAEKALPGDILYPVKVNVNEEVRTWFLASDEAKANWEIERSERRLQEAEQLASTGSLTAKNRAIVESNFTAQSQRVKDRIEKFENKQNFNSAAEISSNFETSLSAHEQVLSSLLDKEDVAGAKNEIQPIVTQVKSAAQVAKKNRQKNETEVTSDKKEGIQVAAEGKLISAQKKLEEANKYIDSVKSGFDAKTEGEVNSKLGAAQTAIDYGKSKLESGNNAEAFTSFQQATRIAQEAKLLIAARHDLKLDVWASSSIGTDKDDDNSIPFKNKGRD
jgi:hypothetical protein